MTASPFGDRFAKHCVRRREHRTRAGAALAAENARRVRCHCGLLILPEDLQRHRAKFCGAVK